MFCLLGSDPEQHFDGAAQISYRAYQGWIESYERSIPITSFRLSATGNSFYRRHYNLPGIGAAQIVDGADDMPARLQLPQQRGTGL